jgi:hypothetical protein
VALTLYGRQRVCERLLGFCVTTPIGKSARRSAAPLWTTNNGTWHEQTPKNFQSIQELSVTIVAAMMRQKTNQR